MKRYLKLPVEYNCSTFLSFLANLITSVNRHQQKQEQGFEKPPLMKTLKLLSSFYRVLSSLYHIIHFVNLSLYKDNDDMEEILNFKA